MSEWTPDGLRRAAVTAEPQAARALYAAADEIERLRAEVERLERYRVAREGEG